MWQYINYETELYHHGVKGMKWGVRHDRQTSKRRYTEHEINQNIINRYKKQARQLSHVRINQNTKGKIFTDKSDKLVGMVNTEKKSDGNIWIQGIEIYGNNKGKGLGYQLLDHAVKNMGATHLSVNKNNKVAKNLYDKYGFKTYSDDSTMYYMRIKHKAK